MGLPIKPAAMMIKGKGVLMTNARKAATLIVHNAGCLSAREPMRHAAKSTIAVTAGLMP